MTEATAATRRWRRARQPLIEAALPFAVARIIVLGALALCHFVVDRTHPATAVAQRVHAGLLGWDAGWYETIARVGYRPLGTQALRFFPALPALGHALGWLPGVSDGAAVVIIANLAAFVATALFFVLVRRESGDVELARRSLWVLSLGPAAFVLVMGYAESLLLVCVLAVFLALRPAGASTRPAFLVAALFGLLAALTRPIGILVALPVLVEVVRWWPRTGRKTRLAGLAAVVAPVVGVAGFLGWSQHVAHDLFAPLHVQLESSHHGGLSDPLATLLHDARGLLHRHVGTALHVPWVLLALILLIVCWRKLPATYSLFAAAILAVAVAGSNLDSFERYALSAFPLSMAGALLCRSSRVERVVLILLAAGLAGYSVLAFMNLYVP